MTVKEMVSQKGYRWQLFLVLMVFIQSEFCGINAIGMYTNRIFVQAGVEGEYVTFASLIVYFVQFLVSLAGVSDCSFCSELNLEREVYYRDFEM